MLYLLNSLTVRLLANVPVIKPNNNYPAHDTVDTIIAWGLAILVVLAAVNIIVQLYKLRNAGESQEGARGPAVNLIVSLIVVTLIVTKGTGFINDWTPLLG